MKLFGNRAQGKERASTGPSLRAVRRPDIGTIILLAVFALGVGIIAYPSFSDWWNSYHQTRTIASYVQSVEKADPKILEHLRNEARAYNVRLARTGGLAAVDDDELDEYKDMLNVDGSGVMGYIQMNSLGINYPIYHGVEESVLQVAIGHIAGTSLPVGGPSTHAVVTGHRGLPRAKLFTNLDQATEGDTFTISVLGETLTYEVDQIRIVLPDDITELRIAEGEDYVTLVTCTPYGVNSHRLLVRGHRIDNAAGIRAIPAEAVQIPNYIAVPGVGIPMLFAYLVGTLIREHLRAKKGSFDPDAVLEQLRGGGADDGKET